MPRSASTPRSSRSPGAFFVVPEHVALDELRRLEVDAPSVHGAVLAVLVEELTRIVRRLERELGTVRPPAYDRVLRA